MRILLPAAMALALVACEGAVDAPVDGTDGGTSADAMSVDGSTGECSADDTRFQSQVATFLETTCTDSACHAPVGPQLPSLSAFDLPSLIESGHIVPGDPQAGLMVRVDPPSPELIMPPTREANAPEDIEALRNWIMAGAPTNCVTPPPAPSPHPNALDQETLFTCDPATASAEPRMRRLGREEWVHAVGGVLTRPALMTNPLGNTDGPYSTFTSQGSFDGATLSLYMDSLAGVRNEPGWVRRSWYRRQGQTGEFSCITFDDTDPDDACRDRFVESLLREGAMMRSPTAAEQAALRGFLDRELTDEPGLGHDRGETLRRVFEAAFVMVGSLFRSQFGDETGTLTNDEIALALAGALTTHAPNGLDNNSVARPELGWVNEYRRLANEGAFSDRGALTSFIGQVFASDSGWALGEDALDAEARLDLQNDYTQNRHEPMIYRRGEFWLAPRIASFFREYFGYADVASVAKDNPAAMPDLKSAIVKMEATASLARSPRPTTKT